MEGQPEEAPQGHSVSEPVEEIDLDPLEASIAKFGLFLMKLDQAISKLPLVSGYEPSRVILYDLRSMIDGHKKAMLAEIHQHRTPDS